MSKLFQKFRPMIRKVRVRDKGNTFVVQNGTVTSITLHHTVIVRFDTAKSTVVLNTGGWDTVTTKRRMNEVSDEYGLGYHVYQDQFSWFVCFDGKIHDFVDNMELSRG